MRGLGNIAKYLGKSVAKRVPVDRPPARLLDVAGGHGMFSAAMCRRHSGLVADVLDLPEAAAHGREMIAEAGMTERVRFREGDLRTTNWGEGYDVLFLFNILHNVTEKEGEQAIRKARRALRPGGTVAILDSEHAGEKGNLSATAGFNELFFFLVSGAQAWPEPTIRDWLARAGFGDVRRKRLLALPNLLFLTARAST